MHACSTRPILPILPEFRYNVVLSNDQDQVQLYNFPRPREYLAFVGVINAQQQVVSSFQSDCAGSQAIALRRQPLSCLTH